MKRTSFLLATLLLAAGTLRAEDGHFEKTIPFPRHDVARLDWSFKKCAIQTVQVRNYPDSEDIEKARASDPKDTSWLWWEFAIDNRGSTGCKIKLWVQILDKNGDVVKSSDRKASVDAFEDDEVRVSTRMRTLF